MEWRKNRLRPPYSFWTFVLILVLMEWRKNIQTLCVSHLQGSFNPCSNGMKKELKNGTEKKIYLDVLILVLMEWRKNTFPYCTTIEIDVLILVLMEWRKNWTGVIRSNLYCVLILVLMEWRKNNNIANFCRYWDDVLILVLMEWRKNWALGVGGGVIQMF